MSKSKTHDDLDPGPAAFKEPDHNNDRPQVPGIPHIAIAEARSAAELLAIALKQSHTNLDAEEENVTHNQIVQALNSFIEATRVPIAPVSDRTQILHSHVRSEAGRQSRIRASVKYANANTNANAPMTLG